MAAPTLADIRALGQKGSAEPYALGRVYGSRLSCYLTWVLARTSLSPNQVTVLGVGLGVLSGLSLWFRLSWWHLAAVVGFQLSYLLDFSDGELARLRRRPSHAGSYLDWLGHLYVPTVAAGMLAVQVRRDGAGAGWAAVGVLAVVGLATLHFSCKEHVVVAYLRRFPADAPTPEVQLALADQPQRVVAVAEGRGSLVGRLRSAAGAVLIYPGAMHLLCLALLVDLLVPGPATLARCTLLAAWALLLSAHAVVSVRKNFRVLTGLDALQGHGPPGGR